MGERERIKALEREFKGAAPANGILRTIHDARQRNSVLCGARARHLKSKAVPRYKLREARPTKLESFHDYILERVKPATPDWIAAPKLLRALQAREYHD